MNFPAINPATEKVEKTYTGHSLAQCRAALQKSVIAQKYWQETSLAERAGLMKNAAGVLVKRKQEFSGLMTMEMGKPITQSRAEIEKCALNCNYFAENAEKFLAPEQVPTESKKSYVRFDAIGTILAIMPWNFPFWQVFRFAAPAIMAGNSAVLKHASNVPGCSLAIQSVFEEAGLPKGVFQSLLVDSETASKLIEMPEIAAVTITGSVAAGAMVAGLAGKNIKKTVLELGGSDAFIVLDDVEIKTCSTQAVNGRTLNSGQSCIAAKRFIVSKKIEKRFTEEFVEKMRSLRVGDPMEKDTQVGPLAKKELVDNLESQLKRSVKMGAKILTGGKRTSVEGKGFFFEPTVLGSVSEKMPVFSEETFGPLAGVMPAEDDEDAVRIANATEFGLGASVWSSDLDRAERLVPKIKAGAVSINKIVRSDPRLPFGGTKKSGYGRELGIFGIREFVNIKAVVVQ